MSETNSGVKNTDESGRSIVTDGGQQEFPEPENADDVCTEFWREHPVVDEADADFAFICPRCQEANALVGEPMGFANKPFRCLECDCISLLDPDALEDISKEATA